MRPKSSWAVIAVLVVLLCLIAACTSANQPVIDLLRDTATPTPFLPLTAATPTLTASSPTQSSPSAPATTTPPTPTQTATPAPSFLLFEEKDFNKTSAGRLNHFAYVCDAGIDSVLPGLEFSSARANNGEYCTIAPADSFLASDGATSFAQIGAIHKIEMDVQIKMLKNADGHNPSVGFLYTCAKKGNASTHEFWLAADGAYLFNEAGQTHPWSWSPQEAKRERILTVDFDARTFTLAASDDPQNPLVLKDIFTCADPQGLKFGIFYRNDASIDAIIKRISIYASAQNPLH